MTMSVWQRTDDFCRRFGMRVPILEAPMAGICPPERAAAVANAGGMGALGALLLSPREITEWVAAFRALSDGPLQINLWIPDPPPVRNAESEARVARFLERWGPPVPAGAGDAPLQDFAAQCDAIAAVRPTVVSSIMGVYPPDVAEQFSALGIAWLACATNIRDARIAEGAGADAIVVQGVEAGGHRGAFDPDDVERSLVGLMALVPRVADSVRVPVVATGGIADGRAVAAALTLGASAVQVGTALLRCPETRLSPVWDAALSECKPEETSLTRAFSGRWARAVATEYVRAANAPDAPEPAPYPVQRGLTAAMRADAVRRGETNGMQMWAGQAAALALAEPAGAIVSRLWHEARELLPSSP